MSELATSYSTSPEQRERAFLLVMAGFLAITVVAGFGSYFLTGHSSVRSPWWVHLHGLSFLSWIVLYTVQNLFVYRGAVDRHRKLGRIGVFLAGWIVFLGFITPPITVITGRTPPVFTPPFFLALDWVNIVFFATLVTAGIALRKKTDWHRRLMFCATACVIYPAIARLLLVSGLMSPLTMTSYLLSFVVAGIAFDLLNRKRLHPAYIIGGVLLFVMGPIINMVAEIPVIVNFANGLV